MNLAALGALAKGLSPSGTDKDFENLLIAATPGGIEAQEKRGQLEFVAEQTLPLDGLDQCADALEKAGFVITVDLPALGKTRKIVDDIFVACKFPDGWSKKATNHAMWSELIDAKGRKRGGIFYKAAFYDRKAHMSLDTRYTCGTDYDTPDRPDDKRRVVVRDCGTVIYATEYVDYREQEVEHGKCIAWLDERYPAWKDVAAYWD